MAKSMSRKGICMAHSGMERGSMLLRGMAPRPSLEGGGEEEGVDVAEREGAPEGGNNNKIYPPYNGLGCSHIVHTAGPQTDIGLMIWMV